MGIRLGRTTQWGKPFGAMALAKSNLSVDTWDKNIMGFTLMDAFSAAQIIRPMIALSENNLSTSHIGGLTTDYVSVQFWHEKAGTPNIASR